MPVRPCDFSHAGHCPVCERDVVFHADTDYFRASLKCPLCNSIPRLRAFSVVLSHLRPNWRELKIHESSPGWDLMSRKLARDCPGYVASQYDPDEPMGALVAAKLGPQTYINVNLDDQPFEDACFDIVVAQDVLEHLFNPDLAIKEIARTLRAGGLFMGTVPIVRGEKPTVRRAVLEGGKEVHLSPPEYHGNPMSKTGSLVVMDWGYDILAYLSHHSGLSFTNFLVKDMDQGIAGELLDVVVGMKLAPHVKVR